MVWICWSYIQLHGRSEIRSCAPYTLTLLPVDLYPDMTSKPITPLRDLSVHTCTGSLWHWQRRWLSSCRSFRKAGYGCRELVFSLSLSLPPSLPPSRNSRMSCLFFQTHSVPRGTDAHLSGVSSRCHQGVQAVCTCILPCDPARGKASRLLEGPDGVEHSSNHFYMLLRKAPRL